MNNYLNSLKEGDNIEITKNERQIQVKVIKKITKTLIRCDYIDFYKSSGVERTSSCYTWKILLPKDATELREQILEGNVRYELKQNISENLINKYKTISLDKLQEINKLLED